MQEIELKIHGMSTTLQPADAYALVLEEVEGFNSGAVSELLLMAIERLGREILTFIFY